MPTYEVEWTTLMWYRTRVEADSFSDAVKKVRQLVEDGNHDDPYMTNDSVNRKHVYEIDPDTGQRKPK